MSPPVQTPFDLLNTRVPAEIISKYINVANSYWRHELPSCVPLLPIGKTSSQPLRSKSLRRVSFVDLCDILSPTANYDASLLLDRIRDVREPTRTEDTKSHEVQHNDDQKFCITFFSYADIMELSAGVSHVLSGKGDNVIAIFVPHFCLSQVAKEIIRSVDNCMTSNVRDTTRHTDRHVAVAGGPPPGIHHPHAHRQGQYASGEYGISPSPYNNPHQQQQLRQQQQQQQYYSGGAPMPPPSVEYDAYGNHTMPPPPGSMGGHYGGESQSFEQAAMGRSPQQPGIYGGMYPGDAEPLPQHPRSMEQ